MMTGSNPRRRAPVRRGGTARSRSPTQAPRGRPRSADAHRAILAATLKLIAEVGYEKLTLGEVASVAGAGKATIYRRWPSKAPLVIEAFSQLPELAAPDTGSVLEDLTAALRSFARILETTPLSRVLPILAAECMHDPELSRLFTPMRDARRQPLLDILKRSVARHELPGDLDLEAAADLIVGPIMTRVCFGGRPVHSRDIRGLVEAALYGVRRLRRR